MRFVRGFGQSRMSMDRIDEIVHRSFQRDGGYGFGNHFRDVFPIM
jgi:hypothetical protein